MRCTLVCTASAPQEFMPRASGGCILDRAWAYAGSAVVRSVPGCCPWQGGGRGTLTMASPDRAQDVQAVIKQVLRVVGAFTHTHADPSDWFIIVASVSSTLLTYMAQRTHMMPD